MKKSALLVLVLVIAVVVLSVVKTLVSNNIATSGVMLGDTEEELAKLETENAILAQKVYEEASLTNIEKKASTMGYIDGKTSYVISSKLPIAAKP